MKKKKLTHQQYRAEVRALETPAQRAFNDFIDPRRSLSGNLRAHKICWMMSNNLIPRKLVSDMRKSAKEQRGVPPRLPSD